MNIEQVKEIANAVLYEGYLLYPYRHSAIKNRRRWTFGVVYPREYSEANGGIEPWMMQTDCLVTGLANTTLDIHVRFPHLLVCTVMRPEGDRVGAPCLTRVGFFEHGDNGDKCRSTRAPCLGDRYPLADTLLASRLADEPREEGVEREISVQALSLDDLVAHPRRVTIAFPGERVVEYPTDGSAAEIVREQQLIAGAVIIAATPVDSSLFKLSVQIENTTPETGTVTNRHDAVLLQSFVSTHTILQVHEGAFISLSRRRRRCGEGTNVHARYWSERNRSRPNNS